MMEKKVAAETNLETKKKLVPKTTKTVKKVKPVSKKSDDFAIISYLNSQFKVSVGTKIWIPLNKKLKKDSTITFQQVLLKNTLIGTPHLTNWTVVGKCLQPEIKDEKITVFKYKSKKNYRVKTGHRQRYSLIEITAFQTKVDKESVTK